MPTDPLESILNRGLAKLRAKEVLEIATPLLQELVNYGSNVLDRCARNAKGQENEDLAALTLYRYILEMTDATEVLLAESCATPAIPLLRSCLEGLLSLEYITESHETYIQRSLSWLAYYVHKRIEFYESLLPTTQRGQEFQASMQRDKRLGPLPNPPPSEVQAAIDNLRTLLSKPQFKEIEAEYAPAKS